MIRRSRRKLSAKSSLNDKEISSIGFYGALVEAPWRWNVLWKNWLRDSWWSVIKAHWNLSTISSYFQSFSLWTPMNCVRKDKHFAFQIDFAKKQLLEKITITQSNEFNINRDPKSTCTYQMHIWIYYLNNVIKINVGISSNSNYITF